VVREPRRGTPDGVWLEDNPLLEQPVSKGTQEDVERIVRRDFLPSEVDAAFALLNAYETTPFKERPARVRLAALKCAEGDLEKLKRELEGARLDYRNVLIDAEYPINYRLTMKTKKPSADEYDESIRQDWRNYNEWLWR
jgi:hypothetical protein